jgi:hypothetical protein
MRRGRALAAAALDRLLSVEDDGDVKAARTALILAPAAGGEGGGDGGNAGSSATALDALALEIARAFAGAGADGVTGAHLKLLRALLRSPAAAELAGVRIAGGAAAAEAAVKAALESLLPAARAAGVVPESAAAPELAAALGGLGAPALEASATAVAKQGALARGPLKLEPGAAAVITNGRVIVDWSPKRDGGGSGVAAGGAEAGLSSEDFGLMQLYAADLQPGGAGRGDGARRVDATGAQGATSGRRLSGWEGS